MSPDRITTLVARWVRLYTVGLPRDAAVRRAGEIRADLHDQIVHERSLHVPEPRIAARIASRAVRGAAADLAWRSHASRTARTRPTEEHPMHTVTLARSAARVSVFVVALLAIPIVGTIVSNEVHWSVFDFVAAGVLLAVVGICLDLALRRRGNLVIAGGVAAAGVAAAVVGELDDAPGLVVIGALLVAGGGAIAHRRLRRAH